MAPQNSGFMAGGRGGSICLNSSHGLMNSNHFYKSQGVGSQKGQTRFGSNHRDNSLTQS